MADVSRSNGQNRFVKGTVSKHGYVKTSVNAFREIGSQAEKVMFSQRRDDTATAFVNASVTAAKTAVTTAYYTYKTNNYLGSKIIDGAVGTAKGAVGVYKFAKNPVMNDGETYRKHLQKHLQTKVVTKVKNLKIVRAMTITKNGVKTATKGAARTYKVTKAVARGDIKITKETLAYAGKSVATKISYGTVSLAKTGSKTALYGLRTGVKAVPRTASAVSGALTATGNEYLQGVGTAVKGVGYAVKGELKTAQLAANGTRSAIKTGFNGARKIATGFSYAKRNGIRKSARKLGKRSVNKIEKSVFNLVRSLFSFAGRMIATPTVAVVVLMIAGAGAIAAALGGAVTTITGENTDVVVEVMDFFGIDGGTDGTVSVDPSKAWNGNGEVENAESEKKKTAVKQVNEEEWLIERIKKTKAEKVKEIKKIMEDDLIENGGEYHEIRFYNSFTDICVPLNDEKDETIVRTLYSDEQLYEIIQPVFHNMLLVKYNLKPTEKEMTKLYDDMVKDMMVIKSAETNSENEWIEFCGDSTRYSINASESQAKGAHTHCHITHDSGCGRVHALDGCLNPDKGYHADDEYVNGGGCNSCCYDYYTCMGHKGDRICGIEEHKHNGDKDEAGYHFIDMWDNGKTISTGMTYDNWKLEDFEVEEHNGKKELKYVIVVCNYTGTQDCEGHSHSEWHSKDDPGCYATKYHNDPNNRNSYSNSDPRVELHFQCNGAEHHSKCKGYMYCKGHKIEKVYFKSVDVDYLIDKYYTKEIKRLTKKKDDKTATDKELAALTQYIENKQIVEEVTRYTASRYGSSEKGIDPNELKNLKITDIHAKIAYGCVMNKVPYVVGGNSLSKGVDDIGLVCGAFSDKGFKHTYKGIAEGCEIIKDKDEKVKQGDIIFYSYDDKTDSIYHVGVALNDEYMVHASNTGTVRVSRIYRAAVHMVGRVS